MNHDQADIDLIERYLGGSLTPSEAAEFAERLESDHELARKLRLRQSFPSLFHAQGEDVIGQDPVASASPRPGEGKRKRIQVTRLVIAIISVSALALVLYILTRTPVTQPDSAEKPVTSTMEPARPQGAEPATKTVTSETHPVDRDEPVHKPVRLESPADSQIFSRNQEILFRWRIETDTFTNFYIFSVSTGKMVWWRGIRPGTRESLVPGGMLSAGTFYWYVGSSDYRRTLLITN